MDYLIGNIDTIVIKELLSNDNFDISIINSFSLYLCGC